MVYPAFSLTGYLVILFEFVLFIEFIFFIQNLAEIARISFILFARMPPRHFFTLAAPRRAPPFLCLPQRRGGAKNCESALHCVFIYVQAIFPY